jgi:hypothetical protein
MPRWRRWGYGCAVTVTEEVQQASNQRPGAWRGWRLDLAVTLAVAVVQVLGTRAAAQGQPGREPLDALAYILLAAGPVALLFRRRFPVAVYALVFCATLATR